MKPLMLFSCLLVLWLCWGSSESAPPPFDFLKQAYEGAKDMYKAYKDMKEANWKGGDKYFHARGNYDAAKRGPGGAWVAEKLSKLSEMWQGGVSRKASKEIKDDQISNAWGRSGKDPNVFRPPGLPGKY